MTKEIVLIQDRSPSMSIVWPETIKAFNEFVVEQQKDTSPCRFSLIGFANEWSIDIDNMKLKNVKPLNYREYRTYGSRTALYDTIRWTIEWTQKRRMLKKYPRNVFLVINTDGYDNASTFTNVGVKDMVKESGYEVMYLAANQDADVVGRTMGIVNTQTFAHNPMGIKEAYIGTTRAATSFRAGD